MKHLTILVATLMGIVGPAAWGFPDDLSIEILEGRLKEKVTLSDLMVYATQTNPSIQAAREAWKATVEKYRVTTAYPDPQFMVTYFQEPIETRLGPQDWNITLSQMIPFPGKLSTAGDVMAVDTRIARLNADRAVRDVAVAIRESYHELLYIQTAREVAAHNAALLEELRKMGEAAYAQDRTAFMDVVKAQSQTGQILYDMLLLEELAVTEKTRINGLLNRPPEAPLGPVVRMSPAPVVFDLEELYPMIQTQTEEIRMADLKVEKAGFQKSLATYENLPEFRVGVFYAGIGHPDVAMPPPNAGDDAIGFQFGMSLPLWFDKNLGRNEQARAEIRRSQAEKSAAVNQISTRIRTVYFKLRNAERLITLYRNDLLPQALKALGTAETWFREGEGSFSDFVETQATVYNFQLSLARAEADYGKALANLERLTGASLTTQTGPTHREAP